MYIYIPTTHIKSNVALYSELHLNRMYCFHLNLRLNAVAYAEKMFIIYCV